MRFNINSDYNAIPDESIISATSTERESETKAPEMCATRKFVAKVAFGGKRAKGCGSSSTKQQYLSKTNSANKYSYSVLRCPVFVLNKYWKLPNGKKHLEKREKRKRERMAPAATVSGSINKIYVRFVHSSKYTWTMNTMQSSQLCVGPMSTWVLGKD